MPSEPAAISSTPLRVAMLIGSMQEGGTENQLALLTKGLRARGHDVRLMLLHPKGALLDAVIDAGIPVHGVGLPKLRPVWNPMGKVETVRCLRRTTNFLREFNPDVLHCWLFEAEAWGWLAKKMGAPGAFITSRRWMGAYKAESPWKWKQRVQDLYNREAALTIANAQAVARDALTREKNLPKEKLRVIYNAVDAEKFRAAPKADLAQISPALAEATRVVITVANYLEYKGYFDLIEAWKIIAREVPGSHLVCVGRDDGLAAEMRSRIHGTGFHHRVHLTGPRADVSSLLRSADLFVLASHVEGLPNAVIEAQAAGLPVVATRTGGTPEALAEGKTGVLVPPHDVDKLALAVGELLRDDEKRKSFGNAGPEFVAMKFGIDRMIGEYEAVYRQIRIR